jgi:hypothetical protein
MITSARRNYIKGWVENENGLGTVELVVILAVLVGIALIFREYIGDFVKEIMANIFSGDLETIKDNPTIIN